MGGIRQCFTSRFGDDGVIMEVDFSQLEVVVLALLTGDEQLKDDVKHRDMHCVTASIIHHVDYDKVYKAVKVDGDPSWTKKRKDAKAPSFQLQYGAGAKSIAPLFSNSEAKAKQFITDYYKRYTGVQQWQQDVMEEFKRSRTSIGKHTPKGFPSRQCTYISPTGRRYIIMEEDSPQWAVDLYKATGGKKGSYTTISPTKAKNFAVQGTATGDYVPFCLGKLYREIKNSQIASDALLINTVHDSIVLDVKKKVLDNAVELVYCVLTQTPKQFSEEFGVVVDVPLGFDISVGASLNETKPIKTWKGV